MKNKRNIILGITFIIGLILYLAGLFLLFGSVFNKVSLLNILFPKTIITTDFLIKIKITGCILFLVGFIIFMLSVILLYRKDNKEENKVNLIIEGKADVLTIIIMTYIMIFMLVICLIFNEVIGALLFGITIIVQSLINWLLIKYYSKSYKRK